jgi:hypothetical protein
MKGVTGNDEFQREEPRPNLRYFDTTDIEKY